MRVRSIIGLALVASLAACAQTGSDNPTAMSVNIDGKPYRCLQAGDMNISQPGTELKGDVRARMLTPGALRAGVRVKTSGTDINQYGQLVANYVDKNDTCTLWTESFTLQEYAQKQGLNPVGISPFYEPAKPEPVPTPGATPVAGATK